MNSSNIFEKIRKPVAVVLLMACAGGTIFIGKVY